MSKHGKIRRYTLIIEKIKSGRNPSFNEIKQYLHNHDFKLHERTIERDIEQIRYEFGVDIRYNRDVNGYYIDLESSVNIESFFKFLEMANTAELMQQNMYDKNSSSKSIIFDSAANLKGIDNLAPLLRAIKENKKITFTHFNFKRNQSKQYEIEPYLLKEFQKRWYIIGVTPNKEMRTFGIDRIEELVVKPETFKHNPKLNPADLFDHVIGIIYESHPVQEVILSFTPLQGMYLKTLPMHHSQKILLDNETECRISIMVAPNYELNELILKYGKNVRVIQPEWLADEIKKDLKEALAGYG